MLAKKQQAPPCGSDSITLLAKRHLAVSASTLEELECSRAACPYPTDGLVFTPAGFPYLLGMPQLLLKWQPAEQAAADISGADLQAAAEELRWELPPGHNTLISNLPSSLIYECQQLRPPARPAVATTTGKAAGPEWKNISWQQRLQEPQPLFWQPVSVRWDKRAGNASSAVVQLEQQAAKGHYLTHQMLLHAVREAGAAAAQQAAAAPARAPAPGGSTTAPQQHPASLLPFDQLLEAVMAEVAPGLVERTVDGATGLEVFCYRQELGPPRSATAAMCRGLVLHPASGSVVAMPFVRFAELGAEAAAAAVAPGAASAQSRTPAMAPGFRGRGSSSSTARSAGQQQEDAEVAMLPGGAGDAANLALYRCGGGTSGGTATASFKVDGSLIIAFQWAGQVYALTRRRMDSEQVGGSRRGHSAWRICICWPSPCTMQRLAAAGEQPSAAVMVPAWLQP